MTHDAFTVALITEVFVGPERAARLERHLRQARALGAELAILPELPLDPWVPAGEEARAADAEPPDGPRRRCLAEAARAAEVAVLGGVIVVDPATGRRYNEAFLLDDAGAELGRYRKVHVPSEPGYWEAAHYEAGDEPPRPIPGLAVPVGVQICSDANRSGCQLLSAAGAGLILVPRATPVESFERWRLVLRADAVTSACYLVSVNRPHPEGGADIGGPSLAIAPDGRVLLETTEPVAIVQLSLAELARARRDYPGYLAARPDVYAEGWAEVAGS